MPKLTEAPLWTAPEKPHARPTNASAPSPMRARPTTPLSYCKLLAISLGLCVVVLSLCAPLCAPYDPTAIDLHTGLQGPSAQHWLGTDALGRDVWSRLLWAGRTSVGVATFILVLTWVVGMSIGLAAGYSCGISDDLAMRLVDLFSALPQVIVALAIVGTLGANLWTVILALSVTGWTSYARLTRSLVLQLCTQDFVLAARALGARPRRIVLRHVLPAVFGPMAVHVSLNMGTIILAIAGLSFLGLGIQPPTPEWGAMLVDARPFLASAPHLVLPPGIAIFLVVLGGNALAEWLTASASPVPR